MDAVRLNDEVFDSGCMAQFDRALPLQIKTGILATFCYFCFPLATLAEPLISLGSLALSMTSQGNSRHPKNFFRVTIGVQVLDFS